jgi:hypothetical protein
MKKLVCIALFSFAVMANAKEKKEIVISSDQKEVVINNESEITSEFSNFNEKTSEIAIFFGCGSEGNQIYDIEISEGENHRDARATRRAWVRKCRNYFWQFGIF